MSYRIFISFAMKDKNVAESLAHEIKHTGAEIVGAESISESADIKSKLTDAMRRSDEIVVIVTKDSANSAWVNYEIGAATALGKKITPILVRVETSELPPVLRSVEGIKFENVKRYVKQLSQNVQSGSATSGAE